MENCLRLAGAQNKAEGLLMQFLKFGGPKIERCKFAVYLPADWPMAGQELTYVRLASQDWDQVDLTEAVLFQ